MRRAYTGSAIRAAEAPLLAEGQGPELMQRAASGLALHLTRLVQQRRGKVYGSRILVLAGTGNNGGDALFAAARLGARGVRLTAVQAGSRLHPEASAAFRAAGGRIMELSEAPGGAALAPVLAEAAAADLLVDALLGTGAAGPLRGGPAALVEALLAAPRLAAVVACDLPSGIDANSGAAAGPVLPAELTVTFGGAKLGLLAGAGEGLAGRVEVVDIGLPLPAEDLLRLDDAELAALFPAPQRSDQKYSRGVLGVVAGSDQYPGAAELCTTAALETGVGMVRYLGPPSVAHLIHGSAPEVVCSDDAVAQNHVQAWLVGPGTNDDDAQLKRSAEALRSGLPAVADAGALSVLPDRCGPQIVLTPHAGELATLFAARGVDADRAAIERDPVAMARAAARLTGATVLLKGATTVIAAPAGPVFTQSEGTQWLATAGSGDTLAGILGALLATLGNDSARFPPLGIPADCRWAAIAAMAASLHGRAAVAASAGGPLRATAIARSLTGVIASLLAA